MKKYLLLASLFLFAGILKGQQTPSKQLIENGVKLHDEEKYAEAIKQYMLIHENDSNYTQMLAELALSYLDWQKYDSAIYYTELGLSIPGGSHANLYITQGTAFDHLGQTRKAIEVYRSGIKKFPYTNLLHYNLGITLLKDKQYKEAEESFKNALTCNPYHASSHLALGKLMARQKQYTKAFLALETFLALEPHSSRSNSTLVYLENLSKNYVDTTKGALIIPFSENSLFEETDHYIRAKIALSSRYQFKVDFNASVVKQTQMLLSVLPYDNNSNNFWGRMYFAFFKAVKDGDHFKPFMYTLLRSSNNEQVAKYIKKNEKLLKDFYSTGSQLGQIRNNRLLNIEGEPKFYSCRHYDNGNIYSIGNSNKAENEEGLWHYFHANGELSAKGKFRDGKKEGFWEYHNYFGQLVSTEEYKDGTLNGTYTNYFENGVIDYHLPYKKDKADGKIIWQDVFGNKTGECNYISHTRQGESKNYYANGEIKDSFCYKDGSIDGEYLTYHPNGQLKEKSFYKGGKPEGENIGYFINGAIAYKGNYKSGQIDGEWFHYYSNGKIKTHGNYIDGKPIGDFKEYYYTGQIEKISKYNEKGELHGVSKSYDREGHRYLEEEFITDAIVRVTSYDKEGNPIETFGDNKGTFDFITYTADRRKINSGSFLNGKRSGEWKTFYKNGNISNHYHFKEGQMNGELKSYHVNGQLSSVSNYINDQIEGYVINYHKNGHKQSEGYYLKNIQDGHWYYYNNDGSLENYYYFKDGSLAGWSLNYAVDGKVKHRTNHLQGNSIERIDYNKSGEIVNNINFSTQNKIRTKSTPDIVIAESNIKGGSYEGKFTWFHPNGKVFSIRNYINGRSEGEYIRYYENGQLHTKGTELYGNDHGKWIYWYKDGNVKHERFYFEDERDSTCTSYYENGKVFREENYFYGQLHGVTNLYNPEGELIVRLTYTENELTSYQYYKNGKLCTPVKIESANQEITAYYNNGKMSYKQQTKNFVPHGTTKILNSDGSPIKIKEYKNGWLDGKYTTFFPNGKLKLETYYSNGLENGEQKAYNDSGKLKTVCMYKNNQEHGKKSVFDDFGKTIRVENYWSGTFIGYDN